MTTRRTRLVIASGIAVLGLADLVLAVVPGHVLRLDATGVAQGGWERYVLVVAAALCAGLVPGLARGRRVAWWLAGAASAASGLAAWANDVDALGLAPAVAAGLALLVTRRRFTGTADARLLGAGWRTLVFGELAVILYAGVGLYFLDAGFRESTSLEVAFTEAIRLAVVVPPSTIEPTSEHAAWFIDSIRVLSALVLALALLRLLAPSLHRQQTRDERGRVQALLERWATSTLAHFQLLDDKAWCFAPDGEAFVGYALVGSTAIALGDPVGRPESQPGAVDSFLRLCDRNGWTPGFHQLEERGAELVRARGLRVLKIGEEAVVPVREFSVSGRAFKSLRSSLNRAEREGIRVEELRQPIDGRTMAELKRVSDAWLGSSGHRERGFTLGRFHPDYLRRTIVFAARDADGQLVAFANLLPSYAGTVGTFDLMRRLPTAVSGTMEMLFVAMIERFRDEGLEGMSLGLAPLANVAGDGVTERVLRAVKSIGTGFNFAGLFAFKDKWRPRWEPRYLGYRAGPELPRVAAAVVRAGEGGGSRVEDAIGRLVRGFPVSVGLLGVTLWLMTVTQDDVPFHRRLVAALGLSWPDLRALDLWRVPASALVNAEPGLQWSIILLLLFVPLAEWRLGSVVTLVTFFVSDMASSLPTLTALRAADLAGDARAEELAGRHDVGSSSGCYGLAAALVASLPPGRSRRVATVALAAWLVGALAVNRDLADVQHVISAAAGAAIVLGLERRPGRTRPFAAAARS